MLQWIANAAFMPHGHCYLQIALTLWLNVTGDALVALAYLALSAVVFVAQATYQLDKETRNLLWLFAVFILPCAFTHIMDVIVVWMPLYNLQGLLKWATGIVSAWTAVAAIRRVRHE